jgi:hypothetical protein
MRVSKFRVVSGNTINGVEVLTIHGVLHFSLFAFQALITK